MDPLYAYFVGLMVGGSFVNAFWIFKITNSLSREGGTAHGRAPDPDSRG